MVRVLALLVGAGFLQWPSAASLQDVPPPPHYRHLTATLLPHTSMAGRGAVLGLGSRGFARALQFSLLADRARRVNGCQDRRVALQRLGDAESPARCREAYMKRISARSFRL